MNEQIKPSAMYVTVFELVSKIASRNRTFIQFDKLHESCVSLLRFIYLYRKKFDEMYVFEISVFA